MFRNLSQIAGRTGARICLWQDRYRQRRALIALSDRALHDIGVGRSEIWRECAKPFWRS